MHRLHAVAVIVGALALGTAAFAQDSSDDHSFIPKGADSMAGSLGAGMPASGSSHSESTSSSSSFGLSVGAPGGRTWIGAPPGLPTGDWRLGEAGKDETCNLRLDKNTRSGDLRYAHTTTGCPEGLWAVARWRGARRELQLTDVTGGPLAHFHRVNAHRFEGQRAKDGAALFIAR